MGRRGRTQGRRLPPMIGPKAWPTVSLALGTALTCPVRALAQQQPTAPASVAELTNSHDRALVRDLQAYITAKPKAEDIDQAYLALFDKAIEHDWFLDNEETARRYLA